MEWPPVKAWTSLFQINEQRYFVAINYGGEGSSRWVNLVSVVNGKILIRVPWSELKDKSKWNRGWIDLLEGEISKTQERKISNSDISQKQKFVCLHPSDDSGLKIPSVSKEIRDWE